MVQTFSCTSSFNPRFSPSSMIRYDARWSTLLKNILYDYITLSFLCLVSSESAVITSFIICTTGDPLLQASSLTILISVYLKWSLRLLGIYGSNFRKLFRRRQKSNAFKSTILRTSWTCKCLTRLMKNTVSVAHTKTDFKKISFKSKLVKSGGPIGWFLATATDLCSLMRSSSRILNVSFLRSFPYWLWRKLIVLRSPFLPSLSDSCSKTRDMFLSMILLTFFAISSLLSLFGA
jgi:hypothetical protein